MSNNDDFNLDITGGDEIDPGQPEPHSVLSTISGIVASAFGWTCVGSCFSSFASNLSEYEC